MKGLNDLKLPLALCSILFSGVLNAAEISSTSESVSENLEAYLSKLKRKSIGYDYQKVEAESSKLRDSWIQPIYLRYNRSTKNSFGADQSNEKFSISIDQPIFRSGGIYFGIKYASALRDYQNYSIDAQKRTLIKQAVDLLMQLKRNELVIAKQELSIKNSKISLEQKTEQYMNGQLDSGFLNNAVIEKNLQIQALYDLQTAQERLVSKFHMISDLDYQVAPIPHLKLINEDEFLERNIDIKMNEAQSEKDRQNKNVTIAKYLPSVSISAGYNWDSFDQLKFNSNAPSITGEDSDYYNYGISAQMPLDINTFRDIESAKVAYLKSQVLIDDKKRELKAIFEYVMQNIANFEKKIELSKENQELYEKLLSETSELFSAGYKTHYDVDILKNSVEIQTIDQSIFEIDKQRELLNLYEKLMDEV